VFGKSMCGSVAAWGWQKIPETFAQTHLVFLL